MTERGQLDRIVSEVLRRLGGVQLPAAQSAPSLAAAAPPAASSPGPGTLSVDDAVVSLATLDGRLEGVRRLQVAPRAVVTPAVRDELRERGIELASQTSGSSTLCCASTAPEIPAAALATWLDGAEPLAATILAEALGRLRRRLADPAASAVLVCQRPLAAACLANRRDQLRAAAVRCAIDARQAVEQIGANLLAIGSDIATPPLLRDIAAVLHIRGEPPATFVEAARRSAADAK